MATDIDAETLNLIIQLQQEDAERLRKGKYSGGGNAPDIELAAQLFAEELEHYKTFQLDRNMSRSMAQAILTDAEAIQASVDQESQARVDREYAASLDDAQNPLNLPPVHAPEADDQLDDDMLAKLTAMYIGGEDPVGESSSQGQRSGKKNKKQKDPTLRYCVSCMTDVSYLDALRCPCSHDYCRDCISALFEAAIGDETLFPARCCSQPIPLGLNRIFLPATLVGRYRAKELEYQTPNRTYCHDRSCSTFIPPQFIRDTRATCIKCNRHTCINCKRKHHRDECPPDMATLDVLRIANDQGWRRCYSCKNMV